MFSPDARAHGLSAADDPAAPSSAAALDVAWPRFGADVLAVAAALRARRLVPPPAPLLALGHSLGGCAALHADAADPSAFAALFLFEPIVWPPAHYAASAGSPRDAADGAEALAAGAERRRATFPTRAAARAQWASKPPFSRWDSRCLDAYVAHGLAEVAAEGGGGGGVALLCAPATEAAVFRAGALPAARPPLEAGPPGACPVWVARGEPGWGGPAAVAAPHVAAALGPRSAAPLCTLPGLSHFGPYEAPERVAAAAVRAWGVRGAARL